MKQAKEIMKTAEASLDGNKLFNAKVCRKDGKTILFVQADEKITNLLHTGNTQTSSKWGTDGDGNGHTFHKRTGYTSAVASVMNQFRDDYGSSIARNGKGNVAFLRTEGVEDGVFFEIDRPVTEENLKATVKSMKKAVEELKSQFLKDVAVISEVREIDIDNTVSTD